MSTLRCPRTHCGGQVLAEPIERGWWRAACTLCAFAVERPGREEQARMERAHRATAAIQAGWEQPRRGRPATRAPRAIVRRDWHAEAEALLAEGWTQAMVAQRLHRDVNQVHFVARLFAQAALQSA